MRPIVAGIFIGVLVLPVVVAAQFTNPGAAGLRIDIDRPSPGPYSEVTATVDDYSLNAFGADIRWYVNGDIQTEANNERSYTFRTGAIGETIALSLELTTVDGTVYSATRSITPSRIDIIIEPQTFTPSFYKGAALPSKGSNVHFTALLFSGESLDPSELMYTWRLNGSTVSGGAVRGQNEVEFEIPLRPNSKVTVSISKRDGTFVGSKTMTIPVVEPEVIFYPVSTLNDLGHLAISSPYQVSGGDLTVRAQPYYVSNETILQSGEVRWNLNNRPLELQSDDVYEVTLGRVISGDSGRLEIEVKDSENIIQRTSGAFTFSN